MHRVIVGSPGGSIRGKMDIIEPGSDTAGTSLPVLDRAAALERIGGDATLLQELLDMLLEQIACGKWSSPDVIWDGSLPPG